VSADAMRAAHTGKLPYQVRASSTEGQALLSLKDTLEAYNEGQLTLDCATAAGTATAP